MTALSELVRYRIETEDPVAKHGQGEVWKATDLLFDELVALKQIRADLRSDRKAIETFRKEASAGARLARLNPHVVPVHDYGRVGDVLFFAMDWIAGGHLGHKCGRVSLRRALSIMRQVTSAVIVAHANGIVHSDIAPMNILEHESTRQVYLTDFGYLKVIDSVLVSRGETSLMTGFRPYYLPPEHLHDPEAINKSSDVYALALTLHMLLSGEALVRSPGGILTVPGVIRVKQEGREAPDEVRKLLQRFVVDRTENDSVTDFRTQLDKIA